MHPTAGTLHSDVSLNTFNLEYKLHKSVKRKTIYYSGMIHQINQSNQIILIICLKNMYLSSKVLLRNNKISFCYVCEQQQKISYNHHDNVTEKNPYQKMVASHFPQLAIFCLWTSGNLCVRSINLKYKLKSLSLVRSIFYNV